MSCCPPSITPDFSDNTGGGGVSGVQSVVAGTNITISGTPTNPQVNAVAGVSAVEGLQGSINLVGVNCGITTAGQDITFTVPPTPPSGVQTVAVTGLGLTQTGTATAPILQNTGVVSLATTGGGLAQTGTATAPILQNTGVVSITTPTPNGSGLTITNGGVGAIQMACQVRSGNGCTVRPSTVDASLFVDNGGVIGITAGTGIQLTGTAQNPIISSAPDGVQTITAGAGITITGTPQNPTIASAPDGVQTVSAGSGITVTGTATNPIINASAGNSNTVVLGPLVPSPPPFGSDTDMSFFSSPIPIPASINLNTINTITITISTGGLCGQPTSGATNASFVSFYGKCNGTGVALQTNNQGQYILYDRASCGAPNSPPTIWDITVNFSKQLNHFNATSTTIDVYKTVISGAPFSSALGFLYQVPTYTVSITGY